ncbi:hypothetical protein KZ451_11080, partial [Glaesserella parasuis]|nr:hypothetical protein [Glaesserella parasuis]MDE3998698.1 hypothetical protein [Glaesserella parasuis]
HFCQSLADFDRLVCMEWLGFGELNYTKFLCRLFFVLKRSTRSSKIIHFMNREIPFLITFIKSQLS